MTLIFTLNATRLCEHSTKITVWRAGAYSFRKKWEKNKSPMSDKQARTVGISPLSSGDGTRSRSINSIFTTSQRRPWTEHQPLSLKSFHTLSYSVFMYICMYMYMYKCDTWHEEQMKTLAFCTKKPPSLIPYNIAPWKQRPLCFMEIWKTSLIFCVKTETEQLHQASHFFFLVKLYNNHIRWLNRHENTGY